MSNELQIYRKRLIPEECILLKDDIIVEQNEDYILTKWKTLNPKTTFSHGCSCYYLKEGFKISKVFDAADRLVYWYCDIIETEYRPNENTYIFHDLLIDVLIYPDKHVEVVDLDEFADFTENLTLPAPLLAKALRQTNNLLRFIYEGHLDELTEPITSRE